jgi:hypothetical protein
MVVNLPLPSVTGIRALSLVSAEFFALFTASRVASVCST